MKKIPRSLSLAFLFLFVCSFAFAENRSSEGLLVHLLSYLAKDYSGAVSNGKIIHSSEYEEQVELSLKALQENEKISKTKNHPEIEEGLKRLHRLISEKAEASQVEKLANDLQAQIVKITGMEVSPTGWPHPAQGKKLYFERNCVSCHGDQGRGDGPLSRNLEPPPTNFFDPGRMGGLSPFQAYQTIRLGIPNTAMPPSQNLSDRDLWDLAFYVLSLRHQGEKSALTPSLQDKVTASSEKIGLATIATNSDLQLQDLFQGSNEEKQAFVAALRLRSGHGTENPLQKAQRYLREAGDDYQRGEKAEAEQKALLAYLEGVEPVEAQLRALDSSFVAELERKMARVRSAMAGGRSWEEVNEALLSAHQYLNQAENLMSQKPTSLWFVFFMAASIILREGFEAVLIIIAILGVLRVVGERQAVRWVHGGWLAALACGVVTWIFSGWVMVLSGASREMMEGVVSLLAVLVLLYVGFWLHSKTEIQRWTSFIDGKTRRALAGGSFLGLASISFMAVFREAFETVLFLRALWIEGGANAKTAMALGVTVSFLLIFISAYALLRFSLRIPIRTFFNISALLMSLLAVILTGKGLHSLQETGMVPITDSPLKLQIDLLGFYPTIETLLPQAAVLILITILWVYGKKTNGLKPAS